MLCKRAKVDSITRFEREFVKEIACARADPADEEIAIRAEMDTIKYLQNCRGECNDGNGGACLEIKQVEERLEILQESMEQRRIQLTALKKRSLEFQYSDGLRISNNNRLL